MIDVIVESPRVDFKALQHASKVYQRHYRFADCLSLPRESHRGNHAESAHLRILPEPLGGLFAVNARHGVSISAWQSKGLSLYAEMDRGAFLVLCALLGLTQWRALVSNPILLAEDFIHETHIPCLFVRRNEVHEYAHLLEDPMICRGCRSFYHCLGVDREIMAVSRFLECIKSRQDVCSPPVPF